MRLRTRVITVVTLAVVGVGLLPSNAWSESRRERSSSRPITKPKFDPSAESVELFDGMEEGVLETKVIANGPNGGKLLITNTTDSPLTVDMPESFVTVHVLKQLGGGFGGGGGGGLGQGGGGQQGGQQNQGGGLGGGGQQGGGQFGGGGGGQQGGGFFSIPPEKTVSLPYVSVCLEHGKPDPTPRATYKLVRVEDYTQDAVLQELIGMVATGKLPSQGAQAAVWTRTDNMSWQELGSKFSYTAIGGKVPYFKANDLRAAQLIVSAAEGKVKERKEKPAEDQKPNPRRLR